MFEENAASYHLESGRLHEQLQFVLTLSAGTEDQQSEASQLSFAFCGTIVSIHQCVVAAALPWSLLQVSASDISHPLCYPARIQSMAESEGRCL